MLTRTHTILAMASYLKDKNNLDIQASVIF